MCGSATPQKSEQGELFQAKETEGLLGPQVLRVRLEAQALRRVPCAFLFQHSHSPALRACHDERPLRAEYRYCRLAAGAAHARYRPQVLLLDFCGGVLALCGL